MNAGCAVGPEQTTWRCWADGDVEKIFKHFFSQKNLFGSIPHTPWSPPTDVYETEEMYVIRLEIPGIQDVAKDVDIELNHNVLAVRGYRRDHCTDLKLGFHQMEIHFGYFERVLTLPHCIDPETRKGSYTDGFLRITIGKTRPRKSERRRVDIRP